MSHNLERDHVSCHNFVFLNCSLHDVLIIYLWYQYTQDDTRAKPFVWLLALTAALGGLIFGYDIGGAGATFVMDGFKYHFGWACHPDDLGE